MKTVFGAVLVQDLDFLLLSAEKNCSTLNELLKKARLSSTGPFFLWQKYISFWPYLDFPVPHQLENVLFDH
jgi:hypothetical protein